MRSSTTHCCCFEFGFWSHLSREAPLLLHCVISASYRSERGVRTACSTRLFALRHIDVIQVTLNIEQKIDNKAIDRSLQIWIVVAHEKESLKIAAFDSGLWTLNRDKHPLQELLVRRYDYVRASTRMSSSLVIGTVESGEVTMTTTQTSADSAGVKQSATVVAAAADEPDTAKNKLLEIEQLARRIENQRENRIPIPFSVRKRFLRECRAIAIQTSSKSRIDLEYLVNLRNEIKLEVEAQKSNPCLLLKEALGFHNESKLLLEILNRGVERVTNEYKDNWFYYQDFSFYNTRIESRWPWIRNPLVASAFYIGIYYLLTPIFFCAIIDDENVCPNGSDPYDGWMTAIYFASTTMSTVGVSCRQCLFAFPGCALTIYCV